MLNDYGYDHCSDADCDCGYDYRHRCHYPHHYHYTITTADTTPTTTTCTTATMTATTSHDAYDEKSVIQTTVGCTAAHLHNSSLRAASRETHQAAVPRFSICRCHEHVNVRGRSFEDHTYSSLKTIGLVAPAESLRHHCLFDSVGNRSPMKSITYLWVAHATSGSVNIKLIAARKLKHPSPSPSKVRGLVLK